MAIVILHRAALAGSPYHEWLSDAGEPLYLIVSAAKLRAFNESVDDLPPGAYAEVRVVEGYDMNGEIELTVLDIARREPVRAIVAHAEFDVERAARLRTYLGIAGQTPESANVYGPPPRTRLPVGITTWRPNCVSRGPTAPCIGSCSGRRCRISRTASRGEPWVWRSTSRR